MSKRKFEIGITIIQSKDSKDYFQSTNEYYFFPSIYGSGRNTISFLGIIERQAKEVIEVLKLKKEEDKDPDVIRWISKQEQKQALYRKKLLAPKKIIQQ